MSSFSEVEECKPKDSVNDYSFLEVSSLSSTGEGQIIPPCSTILITGGASGIGLAYAKRWVANGHKVIACGRRQSALESAMKELPELITFTGDVETSEGRLAIYNKLVVEHPNLNVLVNNAAILTGTTLKLSEQEPFEIYQRLMDINVMAPMHLSMLFAAKFQENKERKAVIINISSLAAFIGNADFASYHASKAAIHNFSLSHRVALKGTNVRLVEIVPGPVATELLPLQFLPNALTTEQHTDQIFKGLEMGLQEIPDSSAASIIRMSRDETDALAAKFHNMSSLFE
jgi:uncharacterized oxidoreductase